MKLFFFLIEKGRLLMPLIELDMDFNRESLGMLLCPSDRRRFGRSISGSLVNRHPALEH